MMLLHLVKKDFLLVKKNIFVMMLLAIAMPLFVTWRVPEISGVIAFIYTVVFTELIICQAVSVEEGKYPKAAALLCSAPYSRSAFVKAKYIFFLLLFAYCYIVYTIMALAVSGVDMIDLTIVLSVLFFGAILYGVYLPFYFKYGAEKTKFFFATCLFIISFGSPMLYKYFMYANFDFSILALVPATVMNISLFLAILIVLIVSQWAAVRIFSKKDL